MEVGSVRQAKGGDYMTNWMLRYLVRYLKKEAKRRGY
jgi:hypothetical protein